MKKRIKTFQLFTREDNTSKEIANNFRTSFASFTNPIVESDDGDLVIAIGGDGTFLDAVSNSKFSKEKIYAGVNTGTLGFLQNISPKEFDLFISFFSETKEVVTRKLYVLEITITLENGKKYSFNAINEIAISGIHCGQISFDEYIENELFQNIHCDKVMVSSNTGDTAHSMNCGGPIDFSGHYLLVRSFDSVIKNSAYENCLPNPIVASNLRYELEKKYKSEIIIDGIFKEFKSAVSTVEIRASSENYINKLELGEYSKVHTVRSKILGI